MAAVVHSPRALADRVIRWNGKPIAKPGLYSGVPMEAYHSGSICDGPSVSTSGLKTIFDDSPADYWHTSYYNPDAAKRREAAHLTLGQAAHHLLLGEPNFRKIFVLRPTELPHYKTGEFRAWHGANTECKEWLQKQTAAGLSVITADQLDDIKGMAKQLGLNAMVRDGILRGLIEHSLFWKDKESGVWLKCRPDAIPTASGDFANLKTARSVQWLDLQRAIADYAYHMGAAMEREGARAVLGFSLSSYALVFVQSTGPWSVRVVQLKPDDIELGWQQCRKAIKAFAAGMKTGRWPGPGGEHDDAAFIDLWEKYRENAKYRIDHADE